MCRKLLQEKVTTTARECLPVSSLTVKCLPYYVQSEDELLLNSDMILIGLLLEYLPACKHCCGDVKVYCSEREGEMFYRGNKMMRQ